MIYSYIAISLNGKRIKGRFEAEDETDLYKKLRASGLFLVRANARNTTKRMFSNSLDIKTISILCKQLSALLQSGMELTESINTCSCVCKKKGYQRSLNEVHLGLLKGGSLSLCLGKTPELYPKFMIDMVKIGEDTGTLKEILDNMSKYYYKEMKLRNKIKTALAYPMLLGICTIVVSIIVTIKVIPEFQNAINSTNTEMPLITNIFIAINRFYSNNLITLMVLSALIIMLIRQYLLSQQGRNMLSRIQINIFPLNKLFLKLSQIKITGSMYVLLCSGHSALKSLEICKDVLENTLLIQRINICIEEIRKGRSFSKALEGTKIFDISFLAMVSVGEETGNIKDTIEEVIRINEDNMEESFSRAVVLIEPIIIIFAALIIVFIIFAALLPMLNIMDSIGGQI